MFGLGELLILLRRATACVGGGGALAIGAVGSRHAGADGDVGIYGAHVGIVQDEVRVVVMELTFILMRKSGGKEKQGE